MSRVYPHPPLAPSVRWAVEADGRPAFVHDTPVGSLCAFEADGPARIVVRSLAGATALAARPRRLALPVQADGGAFELALNGPANLFLEPDAGLPLFLFANPPSEAPPGARVFGPGVHDAGRIELTDGEALYLEGGAVVRGSLYAHGDGVRVGGAGVLDGGGYAHHETRLMVFDGCRDLRVEGIMTVATPSWNLVLGACEGATVENVKLVGWVVCSDGVDVVGSRDVAVRGCFLRNNDDCVAVKAVAYDREESRTDWRRDVERVLVEGCTMYNDRAGNVMEIGFETQAEAIRDVTFRDIDVLAGHGEGGVFTIHNGDRATVSDVLYENVRVEHFYDKLIDFRVLHSRYSKDAERGRIQGVTLRDVEAIRDEYNTVSLIGGFDADHGVRGVTVENLTMGGRRVLSPDDFGLYLKHASEVTVA